MDSFNLSTAFIYQASALCTNSIEVHVTIIIFLVLRSYVIIISLVINSKVTQFKQKICIKLTSFCQSLV